MVNAWLEHVSETRKKNPGMSYTDALVAAKKTYTKVSGSNNNVASNNNVSKSKKSSKKESKKGSKGKKVKSKKSSKGKKVSNPWLDHVAQTRKENPGMSYTDALVAAKKTYKK